MCVCVVCVCITVLFARVSVPTIFYVLFSTRSKYMRAKVENPISKRFILKYPPDLCIIIRVSTEIVDPPSCTYLQSAYDTHRARPQPVFTCMYGSECVSYAPTRIRNYDVLYVAHIVFTRMFACSGFEHARFSKTFSGIKFFFFFTSNSNKYGVNG